MDLFFGDDSRQTSPSREGMDSLIGAGGLYVPSNSVNELEDELNERCALYGFDEDDEFKWSPPRGSWMRKNMEGEFREYFFKDVLQVCNKFEAKAIVVVEDENANPATERTETNEMDALKLLLERVQNELSNQQNDGLVIFDRPSEGDEYGFLSDCAERLRVGTDYSDLKILH